MRFAKYLSLLVLVFLGGCGVIALLGTGTVAGVGGFHYVEGELKVEYIAPYEDVWEATTFALQDLEIEVEETQKDAIDAKIKAKKADGTTVTITLKNKTSGLTLLGIRVGIFGDENASLIIKKAIDKRLGV
jgi:hypothetical protein